MPRSGRSALHGVNHNLKKKKKFSNTIIPSVYLRFLLSAKGIFKEGQHIACGRKQQILTDKYVIKHLRNVLRVFCLISDITLNKM